MIYLDNAATTQPRFFAKDYAQYWANPNSNHALGLETNNQLNQARKRIMKALGVKSGKVLFCRCATEAVEWLCNRFHQYGDNLHTYTSPYDHESVTNNCCDIENIEECIAWEYLSRNYIYLHQYTNHLTGTIFDIEYIGKQVQSTGAFFGSDITAGLGKYPLPQNLDIFCDAVWFSGRKIYCETMGAIWLSDRLFKYLGGSEDNRNEFGLLHGTTNVPGAIALSYAVEHAVNNIKSKQEKWAYLLEHLKVSLYSLGIEADIFNVYGKRTYAINAITFPGINADALSNFLSSRSIYISPGHSACSNDAVEASRVLEVFGLTKEQASQTVRVSFSEDTTTEDIDAFVQGVKEFKELFI